MENADWILWDDPFSAIDILMEKRIIKVIKEDKFLMKKNFIISSHRISTVRFCDQLIFLDQIDGITEQGKNSYTFRYGE